METLLFSHANGFPAGSYKKVFDLLAGDFKIDAIDRLGHNEAYPINENWTNLADELIAHIQKHHSQPIIAVGHSLGGIVSFIAAHRSPELFKGLIMLEPPLIRGVTAGLFYMVKKMGMVDGVTPASASKGRREHFSNQQEAVDFFATKKLFRHFDPQCLRDYVEAGTRPAPKGGVELSYSVSAEVEVFRTTPHNLDSYKKKNLCPAILVKGLQSPLTKSWIINGFAKKHGIKLETIQGGHLFPLEYPEETALFLRKTIRHWNKEHSRVRYDSTSL